MPIPVIVDALRTPIGRFRGALAGVRPDDLAGLVIARSSSATALPADELDDVVFGCANQAGEDNRNVARMGAAAGRPAAVGAGADGEPSVRLGARGDPDLRRAPSAPARASCSSPAASSR